jgi:hypothetical protein
MDIKSKQIVLMTFLLPESSTPTTLTTPEASKHYSNHFASRCHHFSRAPRGLQPHRLRPGTAAVVSC